MDNASVFFKRIMLGLLLALLVLTLLLVLPSGRSYLLAFLLGALLGGALLACRKKRGAFPFPREPKRAGWLAFGLCLLINLPWVLLVRIEPFSDYETYWACACAVASGTPVPDAWYIAMYPHILGTASFLSVFVRLFGPSLLTVSVVNVLLTSLSCLLLYRLTDALADAETAWLAALLWSLAPCKGMLNSLVFSEPLYTCLILLFFWLFVRADRDFRTGAGLPAALLRGAGMGLTLCLVNIVRPIAPILLLALLLWLLFLRGKDLASLSLWQRWIAALLVLLLVYLGGGKLWDRRVERELGMAPAAVPVYNIYVGFNEETQGQWSAEDMDLLFSYYSQGMSTSQAQSRMLPHLRERLASGIDFPRLFASKLIAFLGSDELGGYTYRFTRPESFYRPLMVLCNIAYYAVLLLALRGLGLLFASRRLGAVLLPPLFALGLTLAHLLVEVSTRYHYSIIPVFILCAALGLTGASEKRSKP